VFKVLGCEALSAAFIRDTNQCFKAGIVDEGPQIRTAIAIGFGGQLLDVDIR
jgi:hypothetical protein